MHMSELEAIERDLYTGQRRTIRKVILSEPLEEVDYSVINRIKDKV